MHTRQHTWTTSPPSSGRTGRRSGTTSTSAAFGINAWRGANGDEVIKRHSEEESGHEELYIVLSGRATFTVGGEEVDAPAGHARLRHRPKAERVAVAKEDGTVVLSLGATPGEAYEPSGWDTGYLEGA